MTKEEKNLLFKDLCSRLPYKVKAQIPDKYGGYTSVIENIDIGGYVVDSEGALTEIEWARPYLFPLSSMTEEQKKELFELCTFCIEENWEGKKREVYAIEISSRADPAYCFDHNFYMCGVDMRAIDWLNKNHFDYRGLIPMGLAIDCTNLNIY